jgi:hypothetical protein
MVSDINVILNSPERQNDNTMRIILDSLYFTLLYPLLLLLFLILGIAYARKYYLQRNRTWKPIGIENGLVGIFALLISFTMIVSGNFVRDRSDIIHQEADEIALIFRTSKFYDDTLKKEVHRYLKDFLRIQFSKRRPSEKECKQLLDSIQSIDGKMDRFLLSYVKTHPHIEGDVKNLIVLMERAGAKYYLLLYTFMERTPIPVMISLIGLSFAIAFLVGFMNSFQESINHLVPIIFIIITVLMINGIRDLDNPVGGLITPHYQDLMDVREVVERGY